jgi:MarR family transcriptional regulator, 2-MHQ and catechol-resistance regulon repressor
MGERYQRSLRLLSETFQAFERLSGRHVRELGLTPAQFDVIATLGNTPGMVAKELGRRTLITKGTLTGVIDRLVERGFVERVGSPHDRRSILIRLTPAGDREFERVFGPHVAYCRRAFDGWSADDYERLDVHLVRMRDGFVDAARRPRRRAVAGDAAVSSPESPSTPSMRGRRKRDDA